jgi:hypothetical protein
MNRSTLALVGVVLASLMLIGVLLVAGPKPPAAEKKGPAQITLAMDFGGQTPSGGPGNSSGNASWTFRLKLDNATVYNALNAASKTGNFSFKADWYPNFRSHRVSEIAGVRDGTDNRFWQYYVNGQYLDKGADLVGLGDGDTVRWEFRGALQ